MMPKFNNHMWVSLFLLWALFACSFLPIALNVVGSVIFSIVAMALHNKVDA